MDILKTINEKKSISNNIADIMSSGDSKKKKSRRLEALRDNCKSNLGKAHIEYYIETLRKERRETLQRIVLALFSLSYLTFTLCRVWWYYHPDSNPFPETNYTVSDLIQVIYLLTIIGIVLCGVRKAVSGIKNQNQSKGQIHTHLI